VNISLDQVKSGEKTAMEIYRENISDRSIPDIQQGVLNAMMTQSRKILHALFRSSFHVYEKLLA
jgi:hypothetical protein